MSLSGDEQDSLTEIVNLGVGNAASVLNSMLENHISLDVPSIHVVDINKMEQLDILKNLSGKELVSVKLGFNGVMDGSASLVFPKEESLKLVSMITADDDILEEDIEEMHEATLLEVGNIVINSLIGSISNLLDGQVNYEIPEFKKTKLQELLSLNNLEKGSLVLITHTKFSIKNILANGNIVLYFDPSAFKNLLLSLRKMME